MARILFAVSCLALASTGFAEETAEESRSRLNSRVLGVTVITPDTYSKIGEGKSDWPNPPKSGVIVTQIPPASPAQTAGLKDLDLLLTANGVVLNSKEDFRKIIDETPDGGGIELTLSSFQEKGWSPEIKATTAYPRSAADIARMAMSEKRDEVADHTWISHFRDSSSGKNTSLRLYFEIRNGRPDNLRVKIRYTGDGWLFCDTVRFHGNTRAVATVEAAQVRPVTRRDMTHAREIETAMA